ncbi:MAG: hypothetical protein R3343_09795 [Nitriliruptorales bacterium]|nr:hypothetical protein [Nitriliruptorales bacterium]
MAKIPDPEQYRRAWSQLGLKDRRRIVRAVNRGEALDKRKEAALAVATARRQKRFWSKAWLFGPVGALFTLLSEASWQIYLANAVVLTLIMALMSWFWLRRANRAEDANLAVATGKQRRPKGKSKGGGKQTRRGGEHLPD